MKLIRICHRSYSLKASGLLSGAVELEGMYNGLQLCNVTKRPASASAIMQNVQKLNKFPLLQKIITHLLHVPC